MSKPGKSTETVIQATYPEQDVFQVIADNVTISGFHLTGAKSSKAGIIL
jgi:nitrous oxidase accessory protein